MTQPSDSGVGGAIRKLLASETKPSSEATYARELGLYMSTTEEKRRVVDERLMAIVKLPPAKFRTTADVQKVAKRLAVEQSNVYRLLTRIREHGPISGLLPGYRIKPKSGIARDGFGEPVDGWISAALRDRPGVSIPEVGRLLASKAKLQSARDPASPVTLPGPTSLRRRIEALRAQGNIGGDVMKVGGSILIDQCLVDLAVLDRSDEGGPMERRRVVVTVVFDVPSDLMLGIGVFMERDPLRGLSAALTDLKARVPALADEGIGFVSQPLRIEWIVPEELLPFVDEVEHRTAIVRPDIDLDLTIKHSSLVGVDLRRLLGGRIGPFDLIAGSRKVMLEQEAVGTPSLHGDLLTLAAAETALTFAAEERNRRQMAAVTEADRRPPKSDEAEPADFVKTLGFVFETMIASAPPVQT